MVRLILKTYTLSEANLLTWVHLLRNDFVNIVSLFSEHCETLTRAKLSIYVDFVMRLEGREAGETLLSEACLNYIPYIEQVRSELLRKGLVTAIPSNIREMPAEHWESMIKHTKNWCICLPDELQSNDFFDKINVPELINERCLNMHYWNKPVIIKYLVDQIQTCPTSSLVNVVSSIHFGSCRDENILEALRQRLSQINFDDPSNLGLNLPLHLSKEPLDYSEIIPGILRSNQLSAKILFELFKLDLLTKASVDDLESRWCGISLNSIPSVELFRFFGTTLFQSLSLEAKRRLLASIDINYDEKLLNYRPMLNGLFTSPTLYEQSLPWRLMYYRKHSMQLPIDKSRLFLSLNRYLMIPDDKWIKRLKLYASSTNCTIEWPDEHGLVLIRPRLWSSTTEFTIIFSLLTYTLIRYEEPKAYLRHDFCAFLLSGDPAKVLAEDLEIAGQMGKTLDIQKSAKPFMNVINKIVRERNLDIIFKDSLELIGYLCIIM